MSVSRRAFLSGSSAAIALSSIGATARRAAAADNAIKVASIHDLSGGLDIYGKPMLDLLTFAVEEVNAAGGLLGRKLEIVSYDPQSNMQLYSQYAQQAALKDK